MLSHYLPEAEQRRLIAAAAALHAPYARRDAAWMAALLSSGCRIEEFSLITVGAAVTAIATRRLVIPKEHRKGQRRDHVVLATAALAEALQDLLAIRATLTGIDTVALDPADALVVNRYGTRLSVRSYQKRIKHWAVVAGLSAAVSPHWLRHCRGYNIMRKSGAVDPRGVAQAALGHVSIASTGIYTQLAEHEVRAALERTDARPAARKRDAVRDYRAQVAA